MEENAEGTMSWMYKKPMLPALHKCKYCGKRLRRNDDTVADCYFTFDSVACDWFCNKECAKEYVALCNSIMIKQQELKQYIEEEE